MNKPKPVSSPTQQTFDQGEDDEELGPVPHAGLSRFKAVENTNYAVDLAKANKMHLVGIQGADITDGRKTLVLGMVWQIMRFVLMISAPRPTPFSKALTYCLIFFTPQYRLSITQTLASLNPNGRPPTDMDMLKWAQTTVQTSKSPNKPSPPTASIRSFKDPSISNALFFLDLLDALRPGIVDYSLVVRPANDYEEKRQNGESRFQPRRRKIAKPEKRPY